MARRPRRLPRRRRRGARLVAGARRRPVRGDGRGPRGRAGGARFAGGPGPGAEDRVRPRAVRAGVGGRGPQRLRHPQRHPAPGPHRDLIGRTTAWCSTGTLHDPYTGDADRVRRAGRTRRRPCRSTTSSRCRTPGRRAPSSGTRAQREAFANDPLNLLAVGRPANLQKGDGDAATWLPPNKAFRCAYVARQVCVKTAYGLWVTAAERDALNRELNRCVVATVRPP